jgi:hypothetical protein
MFNFLPRTHGYIIGNPGYLSCIRGYTFYFSESLNSFHKKITLLPFLYKNVLIVQ